MNFKASIKTIMRPHRCLIKNKIVQFISNFPRQKQNMKWKWMKGKYNNRPHFFKLMKKRQFMIIIWLKKIKQSQKKILTKIKYIFANFVIWTAKNRWKLMRITANRTNKNQRIIETSNTVRVNTALNKKTKN
jgi:hypothetical protein